MIAIAVLFLQFKNLLFRADRAAERIFNIFPKTFVRLRGVLGERNRQMTLVQNLRSVFPQMISISERKLAKGRKFSAPYPAVSSQQMRQRRQKEGLLLCLLPRLMIGKIHGERP